MKTLFGLLCAGLLLAACGGNSVPDAADPKAEKPAHEGKADPKDGVYAPYGDPGFKEGDGAKKDDAQLAPLRDLGYDIEAVQADEARLRRLITLSKYLGHEREAWQKPREVIQTLAVQPGQTVVDIGSASGYMAWYLSEAVGPEGQVLAADVDPVACDFIERRLQHEPPPHPNVRVVQSQTDNVTLGQASIDAAVLVDAEFFVVHDDTTRACLKTLFEAVKPLGKVAVIESADKAERGQVTETTILDPFVEAGFTHTETHDLLRHDSHRRPGGQHFLVFSKPGP